MKNTFKPPAYLKNRYVQMILSSSALRTRGPNPMRDASMEMVIDVGSSVRLQGFYSPQTDPRGHVIMLHGWEGNSESTYILGLGKYLYRHGYSVFRLNYRDHGTSHHLNEGLFFVTQIEEILEGVKYAAGLAKDIPVYLVGFSMGGSFALRIGQKCLNDPIKGLRHIAVISPMLDPGKSIDAVDLDPLMRNYFLKRWQRSLMKKQEIYPEIYNLGPVMHLPTCRRITDYVVDKYSAFTDTHDYFSRATITQKTIDDIPVPLTVLTSSDDPAIPVEGFHDLEFSGDKKLILQSSGGHNGFIENLKGRCWYDQRIVEIFDNN
ncbi:MAG: alpha/beta fold hydrolase [Thermodesulfobacteriota bacterium]|nr:alpha/beta fold hydrolase [Thermodesulfobacteriota bacterium]